MKTASILLIGTGRAAHHIGSALKRAGTDLIGVAGRDPERTRSLAERHGVRAFTLDALPTADVILLAVSDDAIGAVAGHIPIGNGTVAHVSGARSLDLLGEHPQKGVLWPIQTLGPGPPIDLSEVPLIVDGNTDRARHDVLELAHAMSRKVLVLDQAQRERVHLAAVLTSNLPVFLAGEGRRLMEEQGLDPDVLLPLWKETAARVAVMGPKDALTGPARRGDRNTLAHHLRLLAHDPDLRTAYATLSEMILRAYGNERNDR